MMRLRLSWLASAAAGLAIAAACFSDHTPTSPTMSADCNTAPGPTPDGNALVQIRNFSFQPASVPVKTSGTVTWVNCEVPGTPSHTSHSDAGVWTSGFLAPGQAYSHTFTAAGAFPYHCEPHPFMTGTVTVQ
jgi:plastocyanin